MLFVFLLFQSEDQQETQADVLDSDLSPGIVQPYEVPYTTHVFVGNGIGETLLLNLIIPLILMS